MRSFLLLCPVVLLNLNCGPVGGCNPDPDAGTGCNNVPNSSPEIAEVSATGSVPAAQGGTLVDGTWHCTDYRWFVSKPAKNRKLTLKVTGTRFEFVDQQNGGAVTPITGVATPAAAGALTIEVSCPQVATLEFDHYTVTATELLLISNVDKKVVTFTRQ